MRKHVLTIHRTERQSGTKIKFWTYGGFITYARGREFRFTAAQLSEVPLPYTTTIVGKLQDTPIPGNNFYHDCRNYSWYGDVYQDFRLSTDKMAIVDYHDVFQLGITSDDFEVHTLLRDKTYNCMNVTQYIYEQNDCFFGLVARLYEESDGGWKAQYTLRQLYRDGFPSDQKFSDAVNSLLQQLSSGAIKPTTNLSPGRHWYSTTVYTDPSQCDIIEAHARDAIARYDLEGWHLTTLRDRTFTLAGLMGECLTNMQDVGTALIASEFAIEGSISASIAKWLKATSGALARIPASTRGKYRYLQDTLKIISSAYLGYQWGVAAPLRDYNSLYDALTEHPEPQRGASAVDRWQVGDWRCSHRLSIAYQQLDPKIEALRFLKQRFGVSFFDVPTIAWELLPMSFAFDWLINVQSLIGSFSTSLKQAAWPIQFMWSTVIREREIYPGVFERYYDRLHISDPPLVTLPLNLGDLSGTFSIERNAKSALALVANIIIK